MSEEIREIYKDEIEEAAEAEEEVEAKEGAEEGMDEEAAEFFEELAEESNVHAAPSDDEFEERVRARKAKVRRKKTARKFLFVVLIIAAFAVIATMCGREIVKLKSENATLQQEQKDLEKERDALKQEVEESDSREFIQEQIKKQMGLLNPGELLFTFEKEEE